MTNAQTDLSIHNSDQGWFVARGYIKTGDASTLDHRISDFYTDAVRAHAQYTHQIMLDAADPRRAP